MIISKKKFQQLVDEKVFEALQKQEEDLRRRFRRIEERLDRIANTVYTRSSASNTPTNG